MFQRFKTVALEYEKPETYEAGLIPPTRLFDRVWLRGNIDAHINTQYQLPILELYVEFEVVKPREEMEEEQQNILGLPELENNIDSEDEFEANYELSDNNDDGDNVDDPVVHEAMQTFVRNDSFGIHP
ncbi:hypothetical protein PIB30_057359 [Stylosanthes scabra]|uniref:Uncharacterized protein n=1 Tax=Stylosanthes scabra TaxID=79078 RepID=A0ABU6ZIB7_9FABA|nr:hypothetical protein [Stylosanthes scabra]